MSETAGAENVIPPTGENEGVVENQSADNPAWNDFLVGFPESMHPMVKERLSKWDEGINQRIDQVHSEWADFKPFKEAGLNSEVLNQAYGIYQAIQDDPQKVWSILGETYGYGSQPQVNPNPANSQQGQVNPQTQQNNQPTGDEYGIDGGQFNPEVARLKAMTEDMAQILIAQENARKQAAEDAMLDGQIKAARDKYGDFNEKFVLSQVQMGDTFEGAIKSWQGLVNEIRSGANRPPAPTIMNGPGTGQLPSQQVDPSKLNGAETRNLVAQMFKAANQQG